MSIKKHRKCTQKTAISECWVVGAIVLPKSSLRKCSCCYWETRPNIKRQHAPTGTDYQRQKYMKKITFCCGFWLWLADRISFNDCDDICDPKLLLKQSRNFQPSPWILVFLPLLTNEVLFLLKKIHHYNLHQYITTSWYILHVWVWWIVELEAQK